LSIVTEPRPIDTTPGDGAQAADAGVIKQARRRQRRRRVMTSSVLLLLAGLGLFALRGGSSSPPDTLRSQPSRSPVIALDTAAVFSRAPYMGVACGVPNWIGCDRIGLSIWLRHPAVAVTATIAGRSFALDDRSWSGPAHDGTRTHFSGFLRHARITARLGVIPGPGQHWSGRGTPSPLVMLEIAEPGHRTIQAWTNVDLMAGWG